MTSLDGQIDRIKMVSFVAYLILFSWLLNYSWLTKAINIGFLIEERTDITPNSSVFPEFCLSKLPEIFGVQKIIRKYQPKRTEDVHYHVNELVSKDCYVVVTYASCEMQELIQVYLTIYGRHHVPLPETHCFRANGIIGNSPVRMRSKNNLLMEAILSLISYLHWKEINIIMDGSFHHQQEVFLMSGLSKNGIRFTLHRFNYTTVAFESEMKRYKPRISARFFLVLMDRRGTVKILQAASRLNLIRYNTQWILGNLDVSDADFQRMNLDPNQVNIAAFKQPCSVSLLRKEAFYKGSTVSIFELTILQSVIHFLNRCFSVLNSDEQFPERVLNSTQMSFFTTISSMDQDYSTLSPYSVVLKNDSIDRYQIVRVEKRHSSHFELRQIAEWCAENKEIIKTTDKIFPNARSGFGNCTLKVAFNEIKPYISKKKGSNPPEFEGFNVDILQQLSFNLNFRYLLIETPDQVFGTLNKSSGEWSGVIGMTARNEVDLGVDPLTLTYERFSVVDYTQPYMEDGISILMKRPDANPTDLLQSYRVFAESTWLAFAVSFILSFTILTIVNRGSAYIQGKENVPKPTRNYRYNFWLMLGYSLQEGSGIEPVNTPGRIIVGFWWLFVILVSTNYTANLAAFLTVSIDPIGIQNIHDLANDDTLTPITIYGSDKYQFFQTAINEDYRKIGQKLKSGKQYKCDTPIIQLVDSHGYAFVTDESLSNYLASRRCGFYLVVSDPAYKQSLGFVLPKGSPYRDMISSSIVSMQEAGLIEKFKKRWWNNSIKCSAPSEERHMKASGLKINNVGGAFIIYTCVAILGILCVIFEIIIARLNRMKKQNRQPLSRADT